MTPGISGSFAASLILMTGLASTGCECIDCNGVGPTLGYLRAAVREETGGAVPGATVHLDNRAYITEPQLTNSDGISVLLVYMAPGPSDTGAVTVSPPAGYKTPLPQGVTIPAGDTVSISFSLERS